jgi:hypothetical protein
MRRVGVDEEEAYRRLRRLASDRNRKLVEVAQLVLGAEDVFRPLEQGALHGRGHRRGASPRPRPEAPPEEQTPPG